MIKKNKINTTLSKKKTFTSYFLRVRSRHPSHSILRKTILLPVRTIIRLGSTTRTNYPAKVEINSIDAIKNSANKLLMKQCFSQAQVETAVWFTSDGTNMTTVNNKKETVAFDKLEFPIVAKSLFGSRGEGNTLIKDVASLREWVKGKTMSNYIFESYYNFVREYRLHVTKKGCFYTCRKMLKEGTPKAEKWHRHDENSVWILEDNPSFDKPTNWSDIVNNSVKALNAVGLDVGAVDVKVQSAKDSKGNKREKPSFIIIEINSAPSFGEMTSQKYIDIIPTIVNEKIKN